MTQSHESFLPELPALFVERAVEAALLEDFGRAGDITTQATIPAGARATARLAARAPGVIAGLDLAETAFRKLDPGVTFRRHLTDAADVEAGTAVAEISGSARALLAAERTALNFIGHMSGIATATNLFARLIAHTEAHIVCTRKTTPGLRAFEKYAVRCGGGRNHRFGLDDAVLIKDNHIAVAGGVVAAIERAKAFAGHLVKVEVEVDTLEQLQAAMTAGPDAVLFDNMTPETMREAVGIVDGRAITEASGGITLETAVAVAETGVDLLSSGWITHSAPVLDLGLDIVID
ncbi:nicotinate-nucleotide pyrophosphorylase (carboxylating) [Rhodobium orientis]|uniref:Probable nicotinate-nucleotide pyrophosphorylase [carboxylating] n=1 Tax=Rhodobium orientis TaxID=34017 RepID=A0A327JCS1_9HYPH|nr:carboxylating nicotinate-nucleotide diphosphorylase [Rhodobium orientis]MBB4303937.1 nicotinate-nucleotide pyrophosphorylase (carboxylating) [Rhodobium orientis]MBK5951481.1 nicotinate-nucleotide diphosphorylase (carboxylating) [Rhodobium orientis]RAI23210.1 nicotinate-nucleotide diphosphorylase (carboxylating) [Rhodobium orientis]